MGDLRITWRDQEQRVRDDKIWRVVPHVVPSLESGEEIDVSEESLTGQCTEVHGRYGTIEYVKVKIGMRD